MKAFHGSPNRRAVAGAIGVVAASTLLLAGCTSSASSVASPSSSGIVNITTPSPTASSSNGIPVPTTGTLLDETLSSAVTKLPLVDQDGKTVSLASLVGKTVVVSPNLTLCQEFCPLISANFQASVKAVQAAGLAGQVVFLEVTVDPGRDDLAHLKAYQGLFGAQPNWEFLRGDAAQVAEFWKAFHLSYDKTADDPGATPHDWLTGKPMTYDVDHSNIVYVLGPDGHIKWLVEAAPNVNGEPLPNTLQKFLSDDGIKDQTTIADPNWTAADVNQAIAFVAGHAIPA